ncbi:MAG: T9SS type A sorting domain-containing protein [Bacteroidia bacterium]|nr:T9SS type A sorting domain-containing protein [Bacteroidia bacterium]
MKNINTSDHTITGIYFGGITPSTFRGNTMYDHYAGLYLNNVAVIDTQTHAGNRWLGTYSSNYGAVNMNDSTLNNLKASLFVIDPNLGSDYSPAIPTDTLDPPFLVNDQGWIFFFPGTPFTCTGQYACNAFIIGDGGSDDLKLRIADDETLTSEYIPESKTIAKQYLYEELKQDSVLLNSNPVFQLFMLQNVNANTGNLSKTKDAITSYGNPADSMQILLSEIDSLFLLFTDSIFKIDSLLFNNTNTNYLQLKTSLINQINALSNQRNNYMEQWRQDNAAYLNNATVFNDAVNNGDDPITNQKMVNEHLITYLQGNKDSIQNAYPMLFSIAQQCPYKGGKAVYQARALVALFNDTIEYSDAAVCIQEGIYRYAVAQPEAINPHVVIRPNPANETVEIILGRAEEGICRVAISNMLNERIQSMQFNCSEKKRSIDLNRLPPGIYSVRVDINNKCAITHKLIVIR